VDVERRQSYEIFECKLLLYTYIALLWVNLYTVYNNMFRCVKLGGGNTCNRILELLISRANSFHGVRRVKENIIKNQIKKFSFCFLFLFLTFPTRIRGKNLLNFYRLSYLKIHSTYNTCVWCVCVCVCVQVM